MHEAALMRDLMQAIRSNAAAAGAERVVRVSVWLGALSHLTPEHFRAHFTDAASGSLAEGAVVDCEVSSDINHPDAAGVRLLTMDVASEEGPCSQPNG